MPVSHFGLTVAHIPSAASFYLATLQPLGYRYLGQSGDSIGLGIDEPDFFLTQEPRGKAVSPAHIAFRADSRLDVRNCYASALHAGAYPSGAPSYRNGECTVFNAAVEDLDGNVVEFVFREGGSPEDEEPDAVSEVSKNRVLTWQKDVAASGIQDDVQSIDPRVSRARSRAETIKTLMSSASRSVRSRSAAPAPGVRRASTAPVTSSTTEFPTKAFFGTILGMAAGATIAWAMTKAEYDNEKAELAFNASIRGRDSTKALTEVQVIDTGSATKAPSTKGPRRNFSVTESHAPTVTPSHRNFSTTDSHISRRFPPRSIARTLRAIQPTAYNDDRSVNEALSRFTSIRRPHPPARSRTIDAIEYVPMSQAGRTSTSTIKRVATLPVEDRSQYLLEAPKPASVESHHSSHAPTKVDDQAESRVSRRSEQRLSADEQGAKSSVSRRSEHGVDAAKPASTTSQHADRRSSVQEEREGSIRSRRSDRRTSVQEEEGSVRSHHSNRRRTSVQEEKEGSIRSRRSDRRTSVQEDKEGSIRSRHSDRRTSVNEEKEGSIRSHHSNRRTSVQEEEEEGSIRSRHSNRRTSIAHDPTRSTTSHHSPAGSENPKSILSRLSRRHRPETNISRLSDYRSPSPSPSHKTRSSASHRSIPDDLPRRDSGISVPSHRSHRSRSSTSTIKASRQPSRVDSVPAIPLPTSVSSSLFSAAAGHALPESHGDGWDEDESDGLGDTRTVVPEDSISCVDFGGRKGGSAVTVPVVGEKRRRRKRSVMSYA